MLIIWRQKSIKMKLDVYIDIKPMIKIENKKLKYKDIKYNNYYDLIDDIVRECNIKRGSGRYEELKSMLMNKIKEVENEKI